MGSASIRHDGVYTPLGVRQQDLTNVTPMGNRPIFSIRPRIFCGLRCSPSEPGPDLNLHAIIEAHALSP
eukprot:12042021-Prorocentrum_lima.AAC.1